MKVKNSVLHPKYKQFESLYDETLSTVAVDEVVIGTVIQMTSREVVINIGYKSEGVVSLNEFRYNPNLKIGDKVEVYVESQEDKKGQLLLSHKKARAINSWDRVNASLEKDEIITGYIKCRTKGGMIVDVFGIEAFLPGSQIDVKPIRDYDVFVGKTMEFKVVKINQEFKNVVVSHKALIEAELEQQKKEIIAKLEKGQVLEGTVKNITSYGVFIDLGGVDGLIHITDLSWGRVNHPEEIVQLDQKLNVVILDFDDDKKRIALGLKQLTSHPWDSVDPNMNIGDKVEMLNRQWVTTHSFAPNAAEVVIGNDASYVKYVHDERSQQAKFHTARGWRTAQAGIRKFEAKIVRGACRTPSAERQERSVANPIPSSSGRWLPSSQPRVPKGSPIGGQWDVWV